MSQGCTFAAPKALYLLTCYFKSMTLSNARPGLLWLSPSLSLSLSLSLLLFPTPLLSHIINLPSPLLSRRGDQPPAIRFSSAGSSAGERKRTSSN